MLWNADFGKIVLFPATNSLCYTKHQITKPGDKSTEIIFAIAGRQQWAGDR
jgi:hypothetical protein